MYSSRSPTAQTNSCVQHLYCQRRTILHEGITGRPIRSSCYTMIKTRPVIDQVQYGRTTAAVQPAHSPLPHVRMLAEALIMLVLPGKVQNFGVVDTTLWHLQFCYHATATIMYPDACYLTCISSVHVSLRGSPAAAPDLQIVHLAPASALGFSIIFPRACPSSCDFCEP